MFLITRPIEKAKRTKSMFDEAGLPAFICPAQKIELLSPKYNSEIAYDIGIVTSTYAVSWLVQQQIKINHLIAIGSATQQHIKQHKYYHSQEILVPEKSNSEGILEMPLMSALDGKNVLLLKGQDGRQLLENTIKKRGAILSILETYRRQSNINNLLIRQVEELPIKCIIVTSTEIAALIIKHFQSDWLSGKYWIVASERIAEFVKSHGFTQISHSQGASDAAIVKVATDLSRKITG